MPRRKTEAPAPVPRTDAFVIDAIKDHIMVHYEAKRPPEVSAGMLALVVELDRLGQPFPNRHHVASHLNCSVFGLDAALAAALNRGMITLEVKTEPSVKMQRRSGVVHERYFHPGDELIEIVRRAKRRAA